MLRHSPELGTKPKLRNLLLERNRHILAGLEIYEPDERSFELARVCAPVQIGLRFDQEVDQVRHRDLALSLL